MNRRVFVLVPLVAALALGPAAVSQDRKAPPKADKSGGAEPLLGVAQGVVDRVEKDSLAVKPRAANGQFQKALTLRLTGTSKVAVLSTQTRGGKVVLTQRDAEARDLTPGQAVAVVYAEAGSDGPVLLSAVAQPAAGK